jgi:hypothetical protein
LNLILNISNLRCLDLIMLLIIIMIKDESHNVLKVSESLGLNFLNSIIGHFLVFDKGIEIVSCQVLDFYSKFFCYKDRY